MNPGSIVCKNCGAASDEPCAEWCAGTVTEARSDLAAGIERRLAGSVPSASVNVSDKGEN